MSAADVQLITRLWKEHGAALVLFARGRCQTPEDVVQEAFVRLATQAEVPENPVAWLYRVVRNAAINAARSATRRERHESAAGLHGEPWFEDFAPQRLDAAEASDALKRLPDRQREVIVARLWGGLSFEEIGQLTGSSTSTAYRHYRLGLEALRERSGVPCRENENFPQT